MKWAGHVSGVGEMRHLYKILVGKREEHSCKGVLPCVLIRSRNLQCEAAKVLRGTPEPLMMET
jgi:hypothetical protein